ncbi:acyltransferase [uncultured Limosilactobacillus sp.]|uniref:acyltransferase n=1 Tax=uncultured Limosilactobacillus sp. TaxID=2837629 RepID=UPI0025CC33E1|nr:acyltransferase [uncultured Limosilactobacillus sp.]
MVEKKGRLLYIDVLNCLAIFSVLMLHSSQIAHFGKIGMPITILGNVLQSIFIPAVYIFFMNSGAMLLNYRKHQTTRVFMIKRVKRVVIPFLFWSVLYYLYDMKWTAFPGPIYHAHPGIRDFIMSFCNNNINNIFWFFYVIIVIYIALPIVSLASEKHKNYLFGISVMSFLTKDFASWFGNLMGIKIHNEYFQFSLLEFIGYSILGYLIQENYFSKKQENCLMTVGFITLFMSIFNDLTVGKFVLVASIGPMLYSVALFIFIKRLCENRNNNEKANRIFMMASSSSLGMYILHVLFYKVFITVFDLKMTSLVYIFVMPVVVYLIGTPLIYFVRKVKIIRDVLP